MKKLKKVLNKILVAGVILNLIFAVLVYVFPGKSVADGAHFQTGNFFLVANVSKSGGWGDPISADRGNILNFKAQITNDGTEDATNVQVKVDLPSGQGTSLLTTFRMKADSLAETTDTATVNVSSSQAMEFANGHTYVTRPGSGSEQITDSIWQNWFNIGTVKAGTTLFVEVLFKTQLTNYVDYSMYLNKQVVNITCRSGWQSQVTAAPGEVVEYKLEWRNTSPADAHGVSFKDDLPVGLTYKTDEPIKVDYPDGQTVNVTDYGALAGNGGGINVGTLAPYVSPDFPYFDATFKATVNSGATGTLANVGHVRSDETNWIDSSASVVIGAPCGVTPTITPTPTVTPTPTPTPTITPTPTLTLTPSPTPTNVPGNNPPVCDDLSVNPSSGGKGLNVTLRGKGHHDSVNGDYINWIKFDYGDGTNTTVDQNFGGSVDYSLNHTYNSEGNYTARFWLRDSVGAERGGDGSCARTVNIFTTKPSLNVVEQPRTGGEVVLSLIFAGLGMAGLVVKRYI